MESSTDYCGAVGMTTKYIDGIKLTWIFFCRMNLYLSFKCMLLGTLNIWTSMNCQLIVFCWISECKKYAWVSPQVWNEKKCWNKESNLKLPPRMNEIGEGCNSYHPKRPWNNVVVSYTWSLLCRTQFHSWE